MSEGQKRLESHCAVVSSSAFLKRSGGEQSEGASTTRFESNYPRLLCVRWHRGLCAPGLPLTPHSSRFVFTGFFHPFIVTCRPRARVSSPGGASSVMTLPAPIVAS